MWTPTHAQVTVIQAKNLICRGRGGTNDAYVTVQLGKEKFRTSIADRSDQPQWNEECDLPVTDLSSVIQLNMHHRTFLGADEFLGHVNIPLSDFPIYDPSNSRNFSLRGKPGKSADGRYRGEIEVKVTFIVKSKFNDESKPGRLRSPSFPSFKEVAENFGSVSLKSKSSISLFQPLGISADKSKQEDDFGYLPQSLVKTGTFPRMFNSLRNNSKIKEAAVFTIAPNRETPSGPKDTHSLMQVIAESNRQKKIERRRRNLSLPEAIETPLLIEDQRRTFDATDGSTPLLVTLKEDAQTVPDIGPLTMTMGESRTIHPPQNNHQNGNSNHQQQIGETKTSSPRKMTKSPSRRFSFQFHTSCQDSPDNLQHVSDWQHYRRMWEEFHKKQKQDEEKRCEEFMNQNKNKSHQELVRLVFKQKMQIEDKDEYINNLEEYIDMLLVRVMYNSPKILQTPYNGPGG